MVAVKNFENHIRNEGQVTIFKRVRAPRSSHNPSFHALARDLHDVLAVAQPHFTTAKILQTKRDMTPFQVFSICFCFSHGAIVEVAVSAQVGCEL